MKFKHLLAATSLMLALGSGLSVAGESGTALKNDNLRAEPFADARISGNFNRGDSLEILKKQGAWLQVKTKGKTGWVRLLSVKRGTGTTSNQAAGVLAVASGRAGTGQVVSTTGVRGLSEQELKAAKFNEAEIKAMESYTITPEQGQQFAKDADLKPINFVNLKAPKGQSK